MSIFGKMLKDLRRSKRMTQRKLAEEVGINFTYISKIENGAEPPSEEVILRIAEVLDADSEKMMLAAKKVPQEMRKTIEEEELAAAFLRSIPNLTIKDREEIRKIINKE